MTRQIPSVCFLKLMGFFCHYVKFPTSSTLEAASALNANVCSTAAVLVFVNFLAIPDFLSFCSMLLSFEVHPQPLRTNSSILNN